MLTDYCRYITRGWRQIKFFEDVSIVGHPPQADDFCPIVIFQLVTKRCLVTIVGIKAALGKQS